MDRKHIFFIIILCLIQQNFVNTFAQSVTVGKGSYSTKLPSGEIGPQDFNGVNVTPKVTSDFSQPIQSNDYWSSLIYPFFGSQYSNILYAHPLNFKAASSGLEIGYTIKHTFAADDFLFPYEKQLTVGIDGLNASKTLTKGYGDWTVTAEWSSGSKKMIATLGHGLPFAFFELTGGDAVITCAQNPTIWYQQNEVLGITINGKDYGIFAPTGSSWSGDKILKSSLNGKNYLSVALLPDNNPTTLELFRSHAYAFVQNSSIAWDYDEVSSMVNSTYSYQTELKDSAAGNLNTTLTALYRHQWLNTNNQLTSYSYSSPRGEMRLLEGNSFTTTLQTTGILPALPDIGDYNKAQLLQLVKDAATETISVQPTYENGKAMARFSNLVHIADQLGATVERDHFLSEIKKRLEDWFTVGGAQEYSYIDKWDVLTGYPSGFGADNQINDHHFHASYAIMSAATIAQFDSAWAAQDNWGGMVNMLIRDANNWDRTDNMFPFLRTFDAYAGHSWAAGHGDFAEGNNQESSSESMNFASAVTLWGEATAQKEIRDLGVFLRTTETSAVEQYWFDIDDVVFPQDYPHVAIGMVWGGKGVHSTWFGADPEFIHGINILPITSGSLYLGRHPEYIIKNYNEIVDERNGQPNVWKDVLWEYLAMSDPNLALSYYYADQSYEPFDGESRAHTLHWLYNMKKLGNLETSITADVATYTVFKNSMGDTTYVAYNSGSSDKLITFSNGFSMTVSPKETKYFSTSKENPNAPVVLMIANKTRGKLPLTVEFTGKNSFDPNGLALNYNWNFDDGDTSNQVNPTHVFKEVGEYNVSLTISNEQNLSSTDSVKISVLGNGTPYSGTPMPVPGIIEAEFYDLGGEGVAYHDVDSKNVGIIFRDNDGVDIEGSNDVGGGYNIGWIEDGEWLEYTINVAAEGMYDIIPVTASVPGGGKIHFEFDGIDLTGEVKVPVTGGWQFWEEVKIPNIKLKSGKQIMHVGFHNGQFNLNRVIIKSSLTDINDIEIIPKQFSLEQNYPNPFNPSTRISYSLPKNGLVSLKVYDILGKEVANLVNKEQSAGNYSITVDGSKFSSGIYIYRLIQNGNVSVRKMTLLK